MKKNAPDVPVRSVRRSVVRGSDGGGGGVGVTCIGGLWRAAASRDVGRHVPTTNSVQPNCTVGV